MTEFRYGAALAGQIESKWQRIWAGQGTFDVPNPVGSLSDGTPLDPASKFPAADPQPRDPTGHVAARVKG